MPKRKRTPSRIASSQNKSKCLGAVACGLEESEEIFRIITEQSPNMIFINQKGRIVFASTMCSRVMGYSKDEFMSPGLSFIDLISKKYKSAMRGAYKMQSEGKEVPPFEYELVTKTGKILDAIITTKLIRYHGVKAILNIVTDISKQKTVERELNESKALYSSTIDHIESAVHLVGENLKVVFANLAP